MRALLDRLLVALAFAASSLGSLGFMLAYGFGAGNSVLGSMLALALAGLAVGLVAWSKRLVGEELTEEEREPAASTREERDEFVAELAREQSAALPRRRFLIVMLAGALGTLGLAALFPLRSLGPLPGGALSRTAWRRGARLVTVDGQPVRVGDLEVGAVRTVYPEGRTDAADSHVLLIRLAGGRNRPLPGREDWTPGGHIAYSRLCTHMGCPVGLYQEELDLVVCPCHWATYDVLDGARPVFGPARRPLPQLPLLVDDEGFLRARDDFDEPVGPGFWDRGREA